ncbi:MAG: hypothetical protein RIE06_33360 [Roseibium album]|uniref:hypothetical protein n=1 Tax=Roseibium album TaxID=311410 RepID=UPI0032ECFC8A
MVKLWLTKPLASEKLLMPNARASGICQPMPRLLSDRDGLFQDHGSSEKIVAARTVKDLKASAATATAAVTPAQARNYFAAAVYVAEYLGTALADTDESKALHCIQVLYDTGAVQQSTSHMQRLSKLFVFRAFAPVPALPGVHLRNLLWFDSSDGSSVWNRLLCLFAEELTA